MKSIDPKSLETPALQALLQGAVSPRPIALVSTVSSSGQVNLSPFSFFNLFSANPPVLIFSPARRVRDNSTKHTLENIAETLECCVNVVSYSMVQQVSLASTEYPKDCNEFVKAGLNELTSQTIKAPRVAESPVQMECKVQQIIELGKEGGAGNLILAKIELIHLNENILSKEGKIDPRKIDTVARMGGDWYCRANGEAIFEVEKPLVKKGIGIDQLPEAIRCSPVLTGNQLAQLANVERIPLLTELEPIEVADLVHSNIQSHWLISQLIEKGNIMAAWKVILLAGFQSSQMQ
jgi:flavin reductase (DIM6/NTAB) family NADH-FMN oxidoreductase RutF